MFLSLCECPTSWYELALHAVGSEQTSASTFALRKYINNSLIIQVDSDHPDSRSSFAPPSGFYSDPLSMRPIEAMLQV